MSVYYYYVNDSKRQFFCIDPAELEIKQYAIGFNIGSRALSYLLLENRSEATGIESHPWVGSWIGDRIYITGDDYGEEFAAVRDSYADIAQNIFELVVHVSPNDLLEYGGIEWLLHAVEQDGERISFHADIRKRISDEFRKAYRQCPSEDLRRAIAALRLD